MNPICGKFLKELIIVEHMVSLHMVQQTIKIGYTTMIVLCLFSREMVVRKIRNLLSLVIDPSALTVERNTV